MKSRKIETITSNEDQVRFEIFSGTLPIDDAGAELLRLERAQHEAERRRHQNTREAMGIEIERLQSEADTWRAHYNRLSRRLGGETHADCGRAIEQANAEIERLRAGIQAFLDGDYEPRVRKLDKCPHGLYGYEACEGCIADWFSKLLANQQQMDKGK